MQETVKNRAIWKNVRKTEIWMSIMLKKHKKPQKTVKLAIFTISMFFINWNNTEVQKY